MTPPSEITSLPGSLIEALQQARAWGFLGDGPLDTHVAHARGFALAAEGSFQKLLPVGMSGGEDSHWGPWMDLGSGGGIPGLVLAHLWPHRQATLLDSNERRAGFLSQVVKDQGWDGRVRVVTDRAEVAGRAGDLRETFALVVARSFGSPPVTAECAAPFLRLGGILIVSEPPGQAASGDLEDLRWPAEPLASIGLESLEIHRDSFGYRVLRQARPCPERFPRRVGVPNKRPLYRVGGG